MPKLIELQTHSSERGSLTVFEKILPQGIKRVFYIYDAQGQTRGGHRHKNAWVALTCVSGSCEVYTNNGEIEMTYMLDSPSKCLLLEPNDWHQMSTFSDDAVLLVLSNQYYDKEDYIFEKYPSKQAV